MIFREYKIHEDSPSELVSTTRIPNLNFEVNPFDLVENFLRDLESTFPVLEIQESDKIDDNMAECLRQLFFYEQISFISLKRWAIKILNIDNKMVGFFPLENLNVEETLIAVMRTFKVARCNFWVEGISPKTLYINVSTEVAPADSMCAA